MRGESAIRCDSRACWLRRLLTLLPGRHRPRLGIAAGPDGDSLQRQADLRRDEPSRMIPRSPSSCRARRSPAPSRLIVQPACFAASSSVDRASRAHSPRARSRRTAQNPAALTPAHSMSVSRHREASALEAHRDHHADERAIGAPAGVLLAPGKPGGDTPSPSFTSRRPVPLTGRGWRPERQLRGGRRLARDGGDVPATRRRQLR